MTASCSTEDGSSGSSSSSGCLGDSHGARSVDLGMLQLQRHSEKGTHLLRRMTTGSHNIMSPSKSCTATARRSDGNNLWMLKDYKVWRQAEQSCLEEGVVPQIPGLPPELLKPAPLTTTATATTSSNNDNSNQSAILKNNANHENSNQAAAIVAAIAIPSENVARLPASSAPGIPSPTTNNTTHRDTRKMSPAQRATELFNERMARKLASLDPFHTSNDNDSISLNGSFSWNHDDPNSNSNSNSNIDKNHEMLDYDAEQDDRKPAAIKKNGNNYCNSNIADDRKLAAKEAIPNSSNNDSHSSWKSTLSLSKPTLHLAFSKRGNATFAAGASDDTEQHTSDLMKPNWNDKDETMAIANEKDKAMATSMGTTISQSPANTTSTSSTSTAAVTVSIPVSRGRGLRGRRNREDREAMRQRILERVGAGDAVSNDSHDGSTTRPGPSILSQTPPTAMPAAVAAEPGQPPATALLIGAPGDALVNTTQPIATRMVQRPEPTAAKIPNATPDAYADDEAQQSQSQSQQGLSEKERIRQQNKALPSSIRPGAYKEIPGRGLVRNDTLRFSIMNNLRRQGASLRRMFTGTRCSTTVVLVLVVEE